LYMICDLDSPFIALAALSISPIMSVLHLYFILLICHHHGESLVFKVNQSEYLIHASFFYYVTFLRS
jgi:hypothetical protein